MTKYYHNIEEDLALGMARADRVLQHIQQQNELIIKLKDKLKKAIELAEQDCPDVYKLNEYHEWRKNRNSVIEQLKKVD